MIVFAKSRRAKAKNDYETWLQSEVSNTLNAFDVGDIRTTTIVLENEDEDSNRDKIRRIQRE